MFTSKVMTITRLMFKQNTIIMHVTDSFKLDVLPSLEANDWQALVVSDLFVALSMLEIIKG